MTVKHVKAVSVPPVMSRSSVTAAAAVKNRQSVKNTVMHMRGLIITDFSYYDVRVKRYFDPNLISTNCSAAKQLPQFSNIRNPLIYCVNRYFLMFGGS